MAAEWLKKLPPIANFKTLPKSGKNALYVNSDGIVEHRPNKLGKSLDFQWDSGRIRVYAAHKHTTSSGGNQGNQAKEMFNLLKRFQSSQMADTILLAIVDGGYYTGNVMRELASYTRPHMPKSFACHIQEVPDILDSVLDNT